MRPNFVYTSALTRSMLVLLCVVYRKFATELRPLIDTRSWFLLHILRMNGQNLIKFCIHIIFDKIYVGIVKRHFFANLQQSYNHSLNSEFGQPWTAELSALDQLKKCFTY